MPDSVDLSQLPSVDGPLQVRYLPLSKLARAPRNPKGHALEVIDNSISRFGFINPIVVNEKTGRIVAGHGRLDTLQRAKAAGKRPPERIVEKDGEWYAPVLVGVAFATDAEAEAFLIADNQTVVLGGYDETILAQILVDHVDTPNGLTGMGFTNDDVANLLLKVNGDAGADAADQDNEPVDKSAELQVKWGTEPGQLWRIGPHRLWCGDSQTPPEELFTRKIRMVWTDPPYGVSYGQKTDWMDQHGAQKHWRPSQTTTSSPTRLRRCSPARSRLPSYTRKPGQLLRHRTVGLARRLHRGVRGRRVLLQALPRLGEAAVRNGPQRLSLSPRAYPVRLD